MVRFDNGKRVCDLSRRLEFAKHSATLVRRCPSGGLWGAVMGDQETRADMSFLCLVCLLQFG